MTTALLSGKFAVITGARRQARPRQGNGKALRRTWRARSPSSTSTRPPPRRRRRRPRPPACRHGVPTSPTSKAAQRPSIAALIARWGQIDILVNNAGITQPREDRRHHAAPTTTRCSTSTCAARSTCRRRCCPRCARAKSGTIVYMSSVSAQRGGGILGGPHYSAAKAGVLGLTKAMAREAGTDGIRVNCHHARASSPPTSTRA